MLGLFLLLIPMAVCTGAPSRKLLSHRVWCTKRVRVDRHVRRARKRLRRTQLRKLRKMQCHSFNLDVGRRIGEAITSGPGIQSNETPKEFIDASKGEDDEVTPGLYDESGYDIDAPPDTEHDCPSLCEHKRRRRRSWQPDAFV